MKRKATFLVSSKQNHGCERRPKKRARNSAPRAMTQATRRLRRRDVDLPSGEVEKRKSERRRRVHNIAHLFFRLAAPFSLGFFLNTCGALPLGAGPSSSSSSPASASAAETDSLATPLVAAAVSSSSSAAATATAAAAAGAACANACGWGERRTRHR